MAGTDHALAEQPHADMDDPLECPLDPYIAFVGAFLRQVVLDAQQTPQRPTHWTEYTGGWTPAVQREAQAFLWDRTRLAAWVELTGAEVDPMQRVLLCAAGLARFPQPGP
jgi:hypothetical protein